MRKCFALFILCCIVVVCTSCLEKETVPPEDGEVFACSDVTYSANAGVPLDLITLSNVPSDFGELVSLIVKSDTSEVNLLVPVEFEVGGEGNFRVPMHPGMHISGGNVTMILVDEMDHECEPATFTINALPDSPGAFREMIELIGDMGSIQERIFGVDLAQVSDVQELKGNAFAAILFTVNEIIRGDTHTHSLQSVANRESPMIEDIPEHVWQLMDGLVERSGMLRALTDYSESLTKRLELITEISSEHVNSKKEKLVTISSVGSSSWLCNSPLHRPNASTLNKLMNFQVENEIYGDGTGLLDASGLLFSASGVMFTAGGFKHVGKAAGIMASGIELAKLRFEMMEGLLPSEFIKIQLKAYPVEFLEDAEKLDGSWEKAMVTAQSRGWSADKAAFNFLLAQLGGRVKGDMIKRHNLKIDEGILALGDFASGLWDSQLTNELFGKEIDRTGVFEVPPCEFGPTDISDEEWSEVQILNADQAPVYLVDRYHYRARATGEAILEVKPRGDKFGRRSFNKAGVFLAAEQVIEVKPIHVEVSPGELSVEPGTSTQFRATVHDAVDKGVAWEVHPAGAHRVTVRTDPDGKSVLMIDTSYDEADFPVTITAISTSSTGLRASPDAPRREGHALLRSRSDKEEIVITPGDCCVEPGKQQVFQAVVRNIDDQRVIWTASAGSIDGDGMFTAPGESATVTVTATSVADPDLHKSVMVRVGQCECRAEWEIGSFDVKQSSDTSRMERAGGDGEGRLTKLLFNNKSNGENMQITFLGNGPLPGEQGTYPVRIINVANEMTAKSVVFKSGTMLVVPSPYHPNGYYAIPPASILEQDIDLESVQMEMLTTVTIDEFTQLGSDPHQVWISGTIQGQVGATEYNDNLSVEQNVSSLHYISSISGSFQGHYTVRHKNPMAAIFTGLDFEVPYVGGGSVYWDVCGLDESEIPFAGSESMDMQEMLNFSDHIDRMEPDDRKEFEEFMNQGGLDGLNDAEGLEGIGDLKDILKMFE